MTITKEMAERGLAVYQAALMEAGYEPHDGAAVFQRPDNGEYGWTVGWPAPDDVVHRAIVLAHESIGAVAPCFSCWVVGLGVRCVAGDCLEVSA